AGTFTDMTRTISGVMTMKMMSSTSTTSTSGVTFMLGRTLRAPFPLSSWIATSALLARLADLEGDPGEPDRLAVPEHGAHLIVAGPAVPLEDERALPGRGVQRPQLGDQGRALDRQLLQVEVSRGGDRHGDRGV